MTAVVLNSSDARLTIGTGVVTLLESFDDRLAQRSAGAGFPANQLPEVLTEISVALLPVDGASLSVLSDDLRVPLAGSDVFARAAEAIQFTLGDGPCLAAYRTGAPAVFSHTVLREQWPDYQAQIAGATPYQSVMSVPLDLSDTVIGALDLYSTEPDGFPDPVVQDAESLAVLLADSLLLAASEHADDLDMPLWLSSPGMHRRATTWIAIGLLSRSADLASVDALHLIRAYARREQRDLDDVTYALAARALTAAQILA